MGTDIDLFALDRAAQDLGGWSGLVTDALLTNLLACECLYHHYIVWGCGIHTLEHTKSFP